MLFRDIVRPVAPVRVSNKRIQQFFSAVTRLDAIEGSAP
jgi:hypothetical protein